MQIHYQNADLFVIEKPAGVVVLPTKASSQLSVLSTLLDNFPEQNKLGEKNRFGIVHRLDKQTSGLLLIARSKKSYDYLTGLFKQRQIEKEYTALVYGKLEKPAVIEKPLTKIGQRGISRVRVDEKGKHSKTEYQPLSVFYRQTEKTQHNQTGVDYFTLLRVKLHTGRTHQIRVHLSDQKNPVMGDDLYGKPDSQKLNDVLTRQFLHATKLEFQLLDKTWITVESELPKDLEKVIKNLEEVKE